MAGYVSPYAARIAALTKQQEDLEASPVGPMFSPEEQERRKTENARNYQLGVLAQLSNDKTIQGVGQPVLKQAMAERQRRVTDHGEYDPMTGQLKMFPEYTRQRTSERLAREQARLQEQEGRGQDQWNRDRERAEDRAFQIRLAAANRPHVDKIKLTGLVDEVTGKPILIDQGGTMMLPGDKPGTFTHYSGGQSAQSRSAHDKSKKEDDAAADTNQQLGVMITRLSSPEGRAAYGTGTAGTAINMLPFGRGIATNMAYSDAEQKLRAQIQEASYATAVKIAGLAQTQRESWRFEPFLVQPDDPADVALNKLHQQHEKLNQLLANKAKRRGAPPGPATPPGGGSPPAQNPGGSLPTLNFDANGNRIQ